MIEYIERGAAIKCIESQCVDGKMWGNDESEGTLIEAYDAIDALNEILSADVVPVVHGRWRAYPDCGVTRCSVCDWSIEECIDYKYCPNCGAKMDGGVGRETD